MDQEILKKLAEQEAKIDAVYKSLEKIRLYFFWILIITVAAVVLPLLGLVVAIPRFISLYTSALGL